MRDPERIDYVLEVLGRAWKSVPDYRLCQLMVNMFGKDPFYVEDDEVARLLELFANGGWRQPEGLEQ